MRREFKVPVNLVNLASDPASGVEGDIYYNTTNDVVRVYANGAWATIGSGGGSSTLDGLTDVTITSTADNEVLAYDNGTSTWINQTPTEAGLVAGVGTNKISYQTTAPSSPATGDVWIDSDASTAAATVDDVPFVNQVSGAVYQALPGGGTNSTSSALTEDVTYYTPFYVAKNSTVFDRISIRAGNSFAGTSTVRLGIYANNNGKPGNLILDAGTVSCTTANAVSSATINQSLDRGIYWLAANTQTVATTNQYHAITGGIALLPLGGRAELNASIVIGWQETGITGAFANAGTVSDASVIPRMSMRVA